MNCVIYSPISSPIKSVPYCRVLEGHFQPRVSDFLFSFFIPQARMYKTKTDPWMQQRNKKTREGNLATRAINWLLFVALSDPLLNAFIFSMSIHLIFWDSIGVSNTEIKWGEWKQIGVYNKQREKRVFVCSWHYTT